MKSKTVKDEKKKEDLNKNKNNESDENPLEIDVKENDENVVPNEVNVSTSKSGVKRPAVNAEKDTTPKKKVRHKSKPQIIENMKDHLDNNTIDKLTTTTLLHWLKENAIHCTTRDKKADLITKVKNHFSAKET